MEEKKMGLLSILEEVMGGYGFSPLTTWALRFFLRNAYESLVITDENGRICFMDRGSEKLFSLSQGGALGLHIDDLLPTTVLPRVLETGYASIGRVLKIKGVNKISSAYPLIRDGKVIGALGRILFHSLEEFDRVSHEMNRLRDEVSTLRQREKNVYKAIYNFDQILGTSKAIRKCVEMAKKIAVVGADVLITGETGTGKELLAHAIHNFAEPEKPFVRVNCPAIPFELAESEFFGYERGAFSGANHSGKKGKFEAANNGTIFLDEINSLPLSVQAKLLRVIQEREVEKVGSTKTRKLNFRITATTNIDLKKATREGKFREDLYYRIARTTIEIPPIRERKEDIQTYIDHFLDALNEQFGTHFKKVSKEALACLVQYNWPGNVRELINVLEQTCLRKWTGNLIPLTSLPPDIISDFQIDTPPSENCLRHNLEEKEISMILHALKKTNGNRRKAALMLGMPRSSFYIKLKKHRIAYP